MLTMKKLTVIGAGAFALITSPMARAATYSDAGAGVLVYAKIVVDDQTDTVVQVANQSASPTAAHCFYVNANRRCTNTGAVCSGSTDCFDASSGFTGACLPGWIEVNFDVLMTPNQPLAWSAAQGLGFKQPAGLFYGNVPCPGGLLNTCPGSNAGTRVPPVGETPFVGELKCIESDPTTRLPRPCNTNDCTGPGVCCRNDLIGSASVESLTFEGDIDVERYNAVGLRSAGFNDGDNVLTIGGSGTGPAAPEYQPCAQVVVFNHLFDGATDPIVDTGLYAHSTLALVPCTEDFAEQQVPQVTAQFLVYNEFEQRFSTSRSVNCLLDTPISLIDTSQPERSIFSASVAGTVAGNTRITGVNGGIIGSATLAFCPITGCTDPASGEPQALGAGYDLNQFSDRVDADIIRIP